MQRLNVRGVEIDDTFAEAFDMRATALVITAPTLRWARQAAITMTGFATSVIGCGCEAGIDGELTSRKTPDGRPGVRVLLFTMSTGELQKQLQNRLGQCVLTSPGSACYAGLDEGEEQLKLGDAIRFFGDGWQIAKKLGPRRYWRVPVMDCAAVRAQLGDCAVITTRAARMSKASANVSSISTPLTFSRCMRRPRTALARAARSPARA